MLVSVFISLVATRPASGEGYMVDVFIVLLFQHTRCVGVWWIRPSCNFSVTFTNKFFSLWTTFAE